MSVYPHACDDMLHDSVGVVDIPNIKLLKKKAKKFNKDLSKLFYEKDELIAKLNESNKLVKKYKNLAKISLSIVLKKKMLLINFRKRKIKNITFENF